MLRKVQTGSGLLIGIPTLGRPINLQWAMAFRSLTPPMNFNASTAIIWGRPVDEARNMLVEEAQKAKAKYLFFLGDDVVPPPQTLRQLIFRMEQNPRLGVVGGVYCSKSTPSAPLIFRENGKGSYWDWKVGEYFDVTGLGMDCTLIRTEVFEKLSKPYFKTVQEDQFDVGVNNQNMWTEDLYFCSKLIEETEYEIYVDTTILCEHWETRENKCYTLPSNSLPYRRLKVINGMKKAVDIGCGPIDRTEQFSNHVLVRVDIREECNPDYRADAKNLPFGDKEFDIVFSSHVLEHFSRDDFELALNEWTRILADDGEMILCLPNIKWAAARLIESNGNLKQDSKEFNDILNVFYGAQSNPYDFHYNGLWPERLEKTLNDNFNLKVINVEHQGYNMILRAKRNLKIEINEVDEVKLEA